MKIVVLCENTAIEPYEQEHGLSLYIETSSHKILMDTGQSDLFLRNAQKAGIDLTQVDTVILSHGHYDHCGGILDFVRINPHAAIYLHEQAGADYYHIEPEVNRYIGISKDILNLKQIRFCHGNLRIDKELSLYSQISHHHPLSANNSVLKRRDGDAFVSDDFRHEQMLVIEDHVTLLCGGCAHNGIRNILESIDITPDYVLSGFHLKQKHYTAEDDQHIANLGNALKHYPCTFYSGHCTGEHAFAILKDILQEQLCAISSGMTLNL